MAKLNCYLLGDAMIGADLFEGACREHLAPWMGEPQAANWIDDWNELQNRRLEIEKKGPEIEDISPLIVGEKEKINLFAALFAPLSSKLFAALPALRIAGVARAGLENVNVADATGRGIAVFNIMGRNAEAVSDFAVGMILAESRNIGRAHYAIKNGEWRKIFSNGDFIPQIKGKKIGIAGFGYIGRLTARKLSGFEAEILVCDPYVDAAEIEKAGCRAVTKEELFGEADYVTLHMRLSEESKGFVNEEAIARMKPTAYLINTGRAGLVDENALYRALERKKIAGAGLDVFSTEPIPADHPFLTLDNVTLTTHIAGTTTEALTSSPGLLMEDIAQFLKGETPRFLVNPEVLNNGDFRAWKESI